MLALDKTDDSDEKNRELDIAYAGSAQRLALLCVFGGRRYCNRTDNLSYGKEEAFALGGSNLTQ